MGTTGSALRLRQILSSRNGYQDLVRSFDFYFHMESNRPHKRKPPTLASFIHQPMTDIHAMPWHGRLPCHATQAAMADIAIALGSIVFTI
jgi:hypothetical protein